jgi:integrase
MKYANGKQQLNYVVSRFKQSEQDLVRVEQHIVVYIVNRSCWEDSYVGKTWGLLQECVVCPVRRTAYNFVSIRDRLMVCVGIKNGRRTGELVNMTLQQFKDDRRSSISS